MNVANKKTGNVIRLENDTWFKGKHGAPDKPVMLPKGTQIYFVWLSIDGTEAMFAGPDPDGTERTNYYIDVDESGNILEPKR